MKIQNTGKNEFQVPNHWIQAAKLAKQFVSDFYDKVGESEFFKWDYHKKFDWWKMKEKIYMALRHTKKWGAYCQYREDNWSYIGINMDDVSSQKDDTMLSGLRKMLYSTASHEFIHHFQHNLKLADMLPVEERKHLNLSRSNFKTNKNSFLYATNWREMDAEIGSFYATFKHLPERKELVQYYSEWYKSPELGQIVGDYVYDYMIDGNKRLDYRDNVWNGIEKENGLFGQAVG